MDIDPVNDQQTALLAETERDILTLILNRDIQPAGVGTGQAEGLLLNAEAHKQAQAFLDYDEDEMDPNGRIEDISIFAVIEDLQNLAAAGAPSDSQAPLQTQTPAEALQPELNPITLSVADEHLSSLIHLLQSLPVNTLSRPLADYSVT